MSGHMLFWPTLALDVLCILVFAIVGRTSHGETSDLRGVLTTVWPFLVGALAGVALGRTWRRPASLAAGVPVWVTTVAVGMTLRVLSGGSIQASFVVVAAVALGVFLLGWRAGFHLIASARARRGPSAPDPRHP